MNVGWSSAGGRFVVQQRSPLAARLFGIPFLLAGLWFCRSFGVGIMQGDLTGAGWALLPLLALAFLVPGVALLFGAKRTEIEAATREVVVVRDVLVARWRRRQPIPANAAVEVRHELRATRLFCPVEIVAGNVRIGVAEMLGDDHEDAASLARDLAAFLGAPVRDLRLRPGETLDEAGSGDAA